MRQVRIAAARSGIHPAKRKDARAVRSPYAVMIEGSGVAMRNYVMGLALLSLLAGCTGEWDSNRSASSRIRQAAADGAAAESVTRSTDSLAARAAALRGSAGFASLPDRGELLAYAQASGQRLARRQAAYRVRLSEEHAFNAAREGGRIVVPTPDGGVATLDYERHVEHPDGNWSWIGRDANGADAVITFGEKAVFGSIPQRDGETLRLTTAAGVAWLATGAGSKVAAMGHGKRAPSADVMLPPQQSGDRSQSETPGAHGNITMAAVDAAPAATGATVDVLLGYTNGLASALGGQSQAATRMANLVDVTNQAYANSGITGRLRLVGAMQVTYADNTDNGDALEQLSGQTETGPTTPNAAFSALRSARESTGADLVALVRDFRTPQNNGCGIAWLIGGGQSGITQADAPFGYAVVSDGSDVDEGDGFTYFCREESLAHELGHNMGQAHNQEDSNQSGVHAYSYGYRESSATGFYTVMAYASGESQFSIRYFANPNVKYSNRPTGVANVADNARSMNQTMPIVATFRAAKALSTARNDLNGNHKSDLMWRDSGAGGGLVLWMMNGHAIASTVVKSLTPGYAIVASGDFNGDGKADLVLRKDANTQLLLWIGNGNGGFTAYTLQTEFGAGWVVAGTGDVNGDAKSDIVWRNSGTGGLVLWLMDGQFVDSAIVKSLTVGYDVVGIGDFNGDGIADLLLRKPANTQSLLWLGNGAGGFTSHTLQSQLGAGWVVAGIGDVNGNGKSDIVWRNPDTGTGGLVMWLMNGHAIASALTKNMTAGYGVVSAADFNGDGKLDLALRSGTRTQLLLWMGNGAGGFTGYTLQSEFGAGWSVIP